MQSRNFKAIRKDSKPLDFMFSKLGIFIENFSIYLKLKMTGSMCLEHAMMNQTLWEHFLELKSPLTLKVNLVDLHQSTNVYLKF